MKLYRFLGLFLLVILTGACLGGPTVDDGMAGERLTFTVGSLRFTMIYVPAGRFPIDITDSRSETVNKPYYIGETEVTWELWNAVYLWATAPVRGGGVYVFAHSGAMGHGPGTTKLHPVTGVSWRDAMVWCNAATEWHNALQGTDFDCVYTAAGVPVRDSTDAKSDRCDSVEMDKSATGFRLPSGAEWQAAARRRKDATNAVTGWRDPYFTRGDSASGANANYRNEEATNAVAWSAVNSGGGTHPVKGLVPNDLGLYDMSGNVDEWCFDRWSATNSYRAIRGGSWKWEARSLQIGNDGFTDPGVGFPFHGFRLVQSAK